MSAAGPSSRLSALLDAETVRSAAGLTRSVPLAVGWATVELDRAVAELAAALLIPAARFVEAPISVALGARCLLADGVLPDGLSLIVLEPATEGRLAATLARHDEGPAAVWLAAGNVTEAMAQAPFGAHGLAQPGPYGTEHLLDGPRFGPHCLLVERPGTIRA